MNHPPPSAIEGYYRLHSKIYDMTRWTFLFGRVAILREVARLTAPRQILEVGCGTGKNIINLCSIFPHASVTGVDISEEMLSLARHKTERFGNQVCLLHHSFDSNFVSETPYDLILFSYALSMFNPGFDSAIAAAYQHLADNGHIAVVDFHDTPFPVFESWMGMNHVQMQAHLWPMLANQFAPRSDQLRLAYFGCWRYLLFVGQKKRIH